MIVNIEFFDEDPMENIITSLNYKVDKTIFFGYERIIREQSEHVKSFLQNTCGVTEVEFCIVDEMDLSMTIAVIEEKVAENHRAGHQVFFDLTGGESLPLVAFGILSKELNAPMHKYDIRANEMYAYGYEGIVRLSDVAESDPSLLNLDEYISIFGGKINYRKQKELNNVWDQSDVDEIKAMWIIYTKYQTTWLYYSNLMRKFAPKQGLIVAVNEKDFLKEFRSVPQTGNIKVFHQFLDDCAKAGFLKSVSYKEGFYRFEYANSTVKNYFWDGGSILEMYTFLQECEREETNDCRVGVHIDWDGVIHDVSNDDVLNEIDIMSIDNNLPTFISCKIGKVDQMALYELSTVANQFGGKYAKKVLAVAKPIAPAHSLRAKEMGIEIKMIQ